MASSSKLSLDAMDVDKQVIRPENGTSAQVDSSNWELLLKDFDKLQIVQHNYHPIDAGSHPLKRDLKSYISSGVINLVSPLSIFCSKIFPPPLSNSWRPLHQSAAVLTSSAGQTFEPLFS